MVVRDALSRMKSFFSFSLSESRTRSAEILRPSSKIDFDVYQPRNPKASAYYRCVEDHFEQLQTLWDERYQSRFGFWRPYVTDVIRRYLDCGDLHFGFARVRCED